MKIENKKARKKRKKRWRRDGLRKLQDIRQKNLRFDEQAPSAHLLGLLDAHGVEDGGGDVAQDTALLLQAPALRGVGQDERHLVGGVGGLGRALLGEHLLGVAGRTS